MLSPITERVRGVGAVAATALEAAQARRAALPGKDVAARILALDDRIKPMDKQTRETFRRHPQAEIIECLPGMRPIPGAEFIAAGDLTASADRGHVGSAAGPVPAPRYSGRRTGPLHRPRRCSRLLRRVLYLSAQTSIIHDVPDRDSCLGKSGEGYEHGQAIIDLARRRASVLWALLLDN